MVKKRIAEAIAEYEKTRANLYNAGGSGSVNTGGIDAPKMEQVFEISKCAEEDKVKFDVSTFEGRALTWWNRNVQTLGLLVLMFPDLVTPEKKKIKQYIQGLPEKVKENVTSLKPTSLHDAINISRTGDKKLLRLMLQPPLKVGAMLGTYHDATVVTHTIMFNALQSVGDVKYLDIKRKTAENKCPKKINQPNEGAHRRAYVMGTENPQQNPNVVTGTFLVHDHYASILFYSGAEKSFVSTTFTPFIDIARADLDTSYEVELAYGKVVSTNIILRVCTLALFNHCFKIDLLPTRLGSFDVIVGMDWLSYHRAVIVCDENIVRVSLPNGEILEIQGERSEKDLRSSCIKADEKKLEDIPIACDFPEVFPNDLSGLPLLREIEFRVNLISGTLNHAYMAVMTE
ncbi:putative reverse transcriptase domain-containing protein [Tanacetum coccineum]